MGDVQRDLMRYNRVVNNTIGFTITRGGDTVQRIVVDMQSSLFADAIATALQDFDSNFSVYRSDSPEGTVDLCLDTQATVLIMEVTAYTPWKLEERLRIRQQVLGELPGCKVVLVVDEKVEKELADRVRLAKKDGLIDNFIYGSVSTTYLSAVVDAL